MYEASEVIAIGEAHDLILGIKPLSDLTDSESVAFRDERVSDVDEDE